jgi:ubiquinone/menaquinone biosynthesis C-methylase UbiE
MTNNFSYPANYFGKNKEQKTESQMNEELHRNVKKNRKDFFEFIMHLKKDASVLDAGCGNGKFIRAALSLRPDLKFKAIDISEVGGLLPAGVDFVRGSVENLPSYYADDTFDAVMCFHVIEHLLEPIDLMQSLSRVMKKGAVLYMETPNWQRVLNPLSPQNYFWNDYTHKRIFSKNTIIRLFTDFNFELIQLKTANLVSFPSIFSLFKKKTVNKPEKEITYSKLNAKFANKNIFSKTLIRMIDLLIRDILIVIARNEK